MAQQGAVSLESLREQIRSIEGAPVQERREATGLAAIDDLVGGLPRPGLVELTGAPGSGRTRLVLSLAAQCTAEGRLAAWVDLERTFYPPAAADLDVILRRLLVVRPPHGRAVWTVEQLLRSGCFPLVVIADPSNPGRAGQRWKLAAEAGHSTGLVIGERPQRRIPAPVRLGLGDGEVVAVRNQGGRTGAVAPVPDWPAEAHPWR